jgi:hypothetical protein
LLVGMIMAVVKLMVLASLLSAVASCVADVPVEEDGSDLPSPVDISDEAQVNTVHVAFQFFVDKGLTQRQSAGIVGNLIQESGVRPTAVQYGGGPGRGIAQWSVGGRWDSSHYDNVVWFANHHGLSRWSLKAQLEFIWYELTNYGYGYNALRSSTTVTGATLAFQNHFEMCGTCDSARRIHDAEQVLTDYGN